MPVSSSNSVLQVPPPVVETVSEPRITASSIAL